MFLLYHFPLTFLLQQKQITKISNDCVVRAIGIFQFPVPFFSLDTAENF